MIPVTKEQIQEVLERLRDYSIVMYGTEQGVKMLTDALLDFEGRKVSLSVRQDGKIVATVQDTGVKAIYDAIITTAPLRSPTTLDHAQYQAMICNKADLSEADQAFFDGVMPFILSYWQRMNAFTFFARVQDVSIEHIARQLEQAR